MDCILISGTANSNLQRYAQDIFHTFPRNDFSTNCFVFADGDIETVYNSHYLLNGGIDRLIVETNLAPDEFFGVHKNCKRLFQNLILMDDRTIHFFVYNAQKHDFVPHSWCYNLYSKYMIDSFDKSSAPVKASFLGSIFHSFGSLFETSAAALISDGDAEL